VAELARVAFVVEVNELKIRRIKCPPWLWITETITSSPNRAFAIFSIESFVKASWAIAKALEARHTLPTKAPIFMENSLAVKIWAGPRRLGKREDLLLENASRFRGSRLDQPSPEVDSFDCGHTSFERSNSPTKSPNGNESKNSGR
jgi:hypothetical protein